MARQIITTITDDIDGTPDAMGHTFALNGKPYEIDLSAANADALVAALQPFIDKARPAGSTVTPKASQSRSKTSKPAGSTPEYDKAAFKTWAVEHDVKLSRGRPPRDVVERYLASVK